MAAVASERIALEALDSSNIGAAGYDPVRRLLAIQFKTDNVIRHYAGVSIVLATAFYCAPSKGRFFHAAIRGKFSATRVTGPCRNCKAEGYIGDRCAACGTSTHVALERHRGEPE